MLSLMSCVNDRTPIGNWCHQHKISVIAAEVVLLISAITLLIIAGALTSIASTGGVWHGITGAELARITDILFKTGGATLGALGLGECTFAAFHHCQDALKSQAILKDMNAKLEGRRAADGVH